MGVQHPAATDTAADVGGAAAAPLLGTVRAALDAGAVRLAFQPVVQASAPDQIAFHEALIRLLDPAGRVIPAGDFIAAVEPTELGRRIDRLALDLGLRTLQGHPGLRLAVNMSARSIGCPLWCETLRRGLAGCPTLGERLILEITESSAMGCPAQVAAFLRELQAQGIAFALDDFGAGFTAVRHLREMPFDIVKFDGGFVRGLAGRRDNRVILGALLTIARHFEMYAVAESVETAADAAACARLGVCGLQGYFFGRPTLQPAWAEAGRLTA